MPLLAMARRRRRPEKMLAAGLLVAALVYLGFASWAGAGPEWLAIEALGVSIYGSLAWLGVRRTGWWLAAGWLAHVLWDVGLHQRGPGSIFTPDWYPPLCIGFDLVIAAGVVAIASNGPVRTRTQPASRRTS